MTSLILNIHIYDERKKNQEIRYCIFFTIIILQRKRDSHIAERCAMERLRVKIIILNDFFFFFLLPEPTEMIFRSVMVGIVLNIHRYIGLEARTIIMTRCSFIPTIQLPGGLLYLWLLLLLHNVIWKVLIPQKKGCDFIFFFLSEVKNM